MHMQYYIERVQKTIDFIEENLDSDFTLEQLAAIAYCSKFHYHRSFQAMVGEPVMEYIRKRRVTSAANEILSTNRKLIDIAYDSGFHSQVDFTRTFKRIYGITPIECRKKVRAVELYEKVNLPGRSFSKEKCSYLNGPAIIEKEGFSVVGTVMKASFEENISGLIIQEQWKNFRTKMDSISGVVNPNAAYGISFEGRYRKHFNYMVCVEVADFKDIPAGMYQRNIPDCKYAVFNFRAMKEGFAITDEFFKALDFIYGQWLPESGYQLNNHNDLIEAITVNPDLMNKVHMDICLPIK